MGRYNGFTPFNPDGSGITGISNPFGSSRSADWLFAHLLGHLPVVIRLQYLSDTHLIFVDGQITSIRTK